MKASRIAMQVATLVSLSLSGSVMAAVSAEEAAQLGDTLNRVGAEIAGNADGTIPAWQPNWKGPDMPAEGGIYPDPFAAEQPLFSITAANISEHDAHLSEGTKVLLNRWADYKLNVYQSHRIVDFPDWLQEASVKNATRAEGTVDGGSLKGAMGGYPFPIPKTGAEVIWNHNLRYYGPPYMAKLSGYLVDSSGNRLLTHELENYTDSPYHDNPEEEQRYFQRRLSNQTGPARMVGEKSLTYMVLNMDRDGLNQIWSYSQGQRRVRLAPDFSYDTPMPGGAYFYDELGMWEGPFDRFDFQLAGKEELYVPYNNYEFMMHTPAAEAYGPQFANPEVMRWEKHRVWKVEATLRPGKRHAQSKKVFYVDEDSWSIVLYEAYDQAGALMRSAQGLLTYDWNTKSVPNTPMVIYDLVRGQYASSMHLHGSSGYVRVERWPNSRLTPDSLAGRGIR